MATGIASDIYNLRPEDVNESNIELLAKTNPLVRLKGKGDELFRLSTFSSGSVAFFNIEESEYGPKVVKKSYSTEEYGQFTIVEIIHDDDD